MTKNRSGRAKADRGEAPDKTSAHTATKIFSFLLLIAIAAATVVILVVIRDTDVRRGGAPPTTTPAGTPVGVPAGAVLRKSGDLVITADGTTLRNLNIIGCVVVDASNVTLERSRVSCTADERGQNAITVQKGRSNFVLKDSEVDGMGRTEVGVAFSDFTLIRVEIHRVGDGARLGDNVNIRNSWIHDMRAVGDQHADGLQSTSGTDVNVSGNYIDPTNHATGASNNAAIMIGTELDDHRIDNMTFSHNFISGGGFTVNIRSDVVTSGIRFASNLFGANSLYGPITSPSSVYINETNRYADSGFPVSP